MIKKIAANTRKQGKFLIWQLRRQNKQTDEYSIFPEKLSISQILKTNKARPGLKPPDFRVQRQLLYL